jgi:hypothetical protein
VIKMYVKSIYTTDTNLNVLSKCSNSSKWQLWMVMHTESADFDIA